MLGRENKRDAPILLTPISEVWTSADKNRALLSLLLFIKKKKNDKALPQQLNTPFISDNVTGNLTFIFLLPGQASLATLKG